MKECSIVYIGFKSGLKFIEGKVDVNKPIEYAKNDDLDFLLKEFIRLIDKNEYSNYQLDILAKDFLKQNDWNVSYSDYEPIEISEAMTRSEEAEFIKKAKSGEIQFKYKKVEDGSIRKARGTLKKEVIKKGLKSLLIAKRKRLIPNTILIYWDLDKDMFRCFRKANFISYI